MMVRSFDRRIESLFILVNERVKQEAILMLDYNLRDNVNSYELQEDGSYEKCQVAEGTEAFDIHKAFFEVKPEEVMQAQLFQQKQIPETLQEVAVMPEAEKEMEYEFFDTTMSC